MKNKSKVFLAVLLIMMQSAYGAAASQDGAVRRDHHLVVQPAVDGSISEWMEYLEVAEELDVRPIICLIGPDRSANKNNSERFLALAKLLDNSALIYMIDFLSDIEAKNGNFYKFVKSLIRQEMQRRGMPIATCKDPDPIMPGPSTSK